MALRRIGLALALAAGLGWAAAGEATYTAPNARIGVVQIEEVFNQYQYLKDVDQQIEREFMPRREAIEKAMAALEQRAKDLANDRMRPEGSEGYLKEKQAIQMEEIRVNNLQEEFFRLLNARQSEKIIAAHAALQRACGDFGVHYNFNLIILTPGIAMPEVVVKSGNPQAVIQEILQRRVLYIMREIDLTDSIIKHMNGNYERHKQNPSSPL